MNKILIIDYGRLKLISSSILLLTGPYFFLLIYILFSLNCPSNSLHSIYLIFYLFFFTFIYMSFIKFVMYFEEFRRDRLILSLINLLFLIFYIIQLLVLMKILNLMINNTEKCDKLYNIDYIGILILFILNLFFIQMMIDIKQYYKKRII